MPGDNDDLIDDDLMMEFGWSSMYGDPTPVRVVANDYAYDRWIVSAFAKRGGANRCVVEDANGRLFIHNSKQLRVMGLEPTP